MMLKIAVMILVHKNENQVNRLVKHLSEDFDIFVHIDKNCSLKIQSMKNNVFVYKKYKTYWGSFNQIIATLHLLKEAYRKEYDRYILISGQDLPIKTNEEIKSFFEHNNNEYIEIFKIPRKDGRRPNPTIDKMTMYHLRKWNIIMRLRRKICHILGKDGIRNAEYVFYGGSNWTNYTHNCAGKILGYLNSDKKYIKRYKWTTCADEIFYQTIIHQIKGLNIEQNCLRYVDWEIGPEYPRILQINDYEKIMRSKNLFARKFDETVDKEIINKIYKVISE